MENKLRKLYLDDLLTSRQIAREIGVSFRTVLRMLDKYGIEKRVAGPKHHAILRDAEWLREQYVSQEKSTTQIANEIRASASVVCSWLKTHGIPRRRVGVHKPYIRTEAHKAQTGLRSSKYVGAANPNYKGGPNRENMRLRTSYAAKTWAVRVKERDSYACVDCGASGVKLHAHHIETWKDCPDKRYDVANGVTVCIPCHEVRHGRQFAKWVHQVGKISTSARPLAIG